MAHPRIAGVAGAHPAGRPPDRVQFGLGFVGLDGFMDITLGMDTGADGVDEL